MNTPGSFDHTAQDIGYYIFLDRDEKTTLCAKGLLDDTIRGYLVLTDKKLFFFFWTNINRDKKFIASHPYLVSAEMKKGTFSSTLTISSKRETFVISRMRKHKAILFMEKLEDIVSKNRK